MNDGSDDIRIQRYETLSRQSRSDAGKIAVVGGGRLKHFDVRLNIDCPLLHSHTPNHLRIFLLHSAFEPRLRTSCLREEAWLGSP